MTEFKVAVAQATPILFDKNACLEKVRKFAQAASEKKCNCILFPESFIPGYPRGFTFGTKVGSRSDEGRELYTFYHSESISIGDEASQELENISASCQIYIVIGVTEKDPENGSLYCSTLYFSPEKGLLFHRRKLIPTAHERIIWGRGGKEGLKVIDTPFGKWGGLTCWENYMPEIRLELIRQGIQIYFAPTADARNTWLSSMVHIAMEARAYVVSANQYVTANDLPEALEHAIESPEDIACRGGSCIISPLGEVIAGPLWDEEGLLMADLDLNHVIASKLDFDPNGHYKRDDLF